MAPRRRQRPKSPIQLSVGGFFRTAYMVVLDDDNSLPDNVAQEPGDDKAEDGVFSDAEIHFVGRTVLDNGLEVGARVELEGEDDDNRRGDGDQIDEAWVYFAGGFGEIRIGSDDEALANSCVLPPGGTANFSAFSPNQWGANSLNSFPFGNVSNSACTGVDDRSDAQKIVYFSPLFHGFQLSASYTPNPDAERHGDGVGAHIGMPPKSLRETNGDADSDASAYLTYSYQGRNWGLTWGGGASWEMGTDDRRSWISRTRISTRPDSPSTSAGSRSAACSSTTTISDSFESLTVAISARSQRLGRRRRHCVQLPRLDLRRAILLPAGHLPAGFRTATISRSSRCSSARWRRSITRSGPASISTARSAILGATAIRESVVRRTGDDDYDGLEFGIGTALSF